jgi:hypothetical protein
MFQRRRENLVNRLSTARFTPGLLKNLLRADAINRQQRLFELVRYFCRADS